MLFGESFDKQDVVSPTYFKSGSCKWRWVAKQGDRWQSRDIGGYAG